MPLMDGVELSKQLRVFIPGIKVVFASGYGGEELARQISVMPDAVLLEKPFTKHALLTKIHALLHEPAISAG
jgi:CheY-like chemotaxis protein